MVCELCGKETPYLHEDGEVFRNRIMLDKEKDNISKLICDDCAEKVKDFLNDVESFKV